MKRFFVLILTAVLFITFLPGCGRDEIPTEPTELWVVTETSRSSGMNDQAEYFIEQFTEQYPNVTVRLDILPVDKEERAVYLNSLRTQIMAGAGPDVYLMPTSNYIWVDSNNYWHVEPLFRDVTQCMYNGLFADISDYYDHDDTLGKEAFTPGVMEAGILNDSRYVLPMRYNYPVILMDKESEYAPSLFDGGIDDIYAYALSQEDSAILNGLIVRTELRAFSSPVDYEALDVTLDAQEVAGLLEQYRAMLQERTRTFTLSAQKRLNYTLGGYIDNNSYFALNGHPFRTVAMDSLLEASIAAKLSGAQIDAVPVRTTDGDILAEITYYGAVGAGCKYPRLAYEFLRLFLSEEAQWEQHPPRTTTPLSYLYGLIDQGCPVRSVGSAQPLFENIRVYQKFAWKMQYQDRNTRLNSLLDPSFTVTDADVPNLSQPVDIARFPIILVEDDSFEHYVDILTSSEDSDELDTNALAQQFIDNLKQYLKEG